MYKAANTARGHSLRPSSKRRDLQGSDQHKEGARRTIGRKSLQVNSWQQELGKERRLLTEREKPGLKPSRTVRPREGNRTPSMAGSRNCMSLPQGAWGGL